MSNLRPATNLDFDQIKEDLIDYIKNNPTFSDYNFEGAALNAIADLLAFNTHTNAYYANMLHNESFLDTAQKRSSVVSKAKELGYVPRSTTCSTAFLDITAIGSSTDPEIVIPRGTQFTSTNDEGSFTFFAVEPVASNFVGVTHTFENVKVVCGTPVKNFFKVDTSTNLRSVFTIPNKGVDTSTLKVYVLDSISAIEKVEYFLADNIYALTSNSNVYFLQESYEGFFEIYFGSNVIGKQPIDGNVIDVDYFASDSGKLADGCREFGFSGTIGLTTSINIETTQVSFAGADKESLESIKFNAIQSNSAKKRAVSASDYAVTLKNNFSFVNTASVWGGEDNIPPVYGKVFVSIQPVSGYTISDSVKRELITPVLRSQSIMTVGIEYVDPTYLEMYFTTKIKFNQNKTVTSKSEIESIVKNKITQYIDSISTFNKDYLESVLSAQLSGIDSGVVSVNISKKLGFRLTPLLTVESSHEKSVYNAIQEGSIVSSKFFAPVGDEKVLVYIGEVANTFNEDNLKVLGLFDGADTLVKQIGFVNLATGQFSLTFTIDSYNSINRFIAVQFSLVGDDVVASRNQILRMARTTVSSADQEFNTVVVESYDK